MRKLRLLTGVAVAALLVAATLAGATTLGSAFNYQGLLKLSGSAVSGPYDFTFRLFTDSTGATQVGTSQTVLGVPVTNGLFSSNLDFGAAVFDGSARWLDIQVRASGGGAYTQLSPRQPVLAVPYALRAINGPSGSSQWTNDANGIDYPGLVGIGMASVPGQMLRVDGGTASNPIVATNNSANNATLAIGNSAGNGLGFYDGTSTRHYLTGSLGINTLAPGAKIDVNGASGGYGVRATITGQLINTINAAVSGVGNSGSGFGGTGAQGVRGVSTDAEGVYGASTNYYGVSGTSSASIGVYGASTNYIGVYGYSQNLDGTWGYSAGANKSGVVGISGSASGKGGYFRNDGGGIALYADGPTTVKTLTILGGADLAERFDAPRVEPGTVMAIDPRAPGRLRVAAGAYCRTVAGVVSGANGLHAGVELGRGEVRDGTQPIALSGRVWVRCDATRAPIHPGDLLTTAGRAGYAMVAADHRRASGAILGKAMTSLETGTGLVLVLVSLQ